MSGRTLVRARPVQRRPPSIQSASGGGGQDQQEAIYALMGIDTPDTFRPAVTERNVAGLTGAWAAVRKITGACSQMMVAATALGADGTEMENTPQILSDPCAGYDSYVFWSEVFSTCLYRGNFVGLKADYDTWGYPRQIVPVPIDSAHAWYEDGFVVYSIGGVEYAPDDVVHVKMGVTIPGQVFAIGVVEAHRRGLAGMLDQANMASTVWRTGAVPAGIVTLDADSPTQTQADTVKRNWISAMGGKRTVAVLGRKMVFTPITFNLEDQQFLQSRNFSIAECCLLFGLQPEALGASFGTASGSISYGNRADDALARIAESYLPICIPVEQAWSRLIPGKNYVEASVEALMRSTPRERLQLHLLAQQCGVETQAESRAMEGQPLAEELGSPDDPTGGTGDTTTCGNCGLGMTMPTTSAMTMPTKCPACGSALPPSTPAGGAPQADVGVPAIPPPANLEAKAGKSG